MDTGALREFGMARENEERRDGGCAVIFDAKSQRYAVGKPGEGPYQLFGGGVPKEEDIQDGILREVREESGLHDFAHVETIATALTHYHNRKKNVNRIAHATCLLVILNSADLVPTKHEAHEDFTLQWVTKNELLANWELFNVDKGLDHWIFFVDRGVKRLKEQGFDTSSSIS